MVRAKSVTVVAVLVLIALLGASAFTTVGHAQVDTPDMGDFDGARFITVTGNGRVNVSPDEAVITLGVVTDAPNAAEALAENSRQMGTVLNALQQAGIARQDVQTQRLQLQPRRANEPGPVQTGTPDIAGFTAINTVTVRVRSIEQLTQALDRATEAGANEIQGINFTVSDPEAYLRQARQEAWQDARNQANELASLAGLGVGNVLRISESGPALPYGAGGGFAAAESVPIAPGTETVNVSIQVTWALTGAGVGAGMAPVSPTPYTGTGAGVAGTATPVLTATVEILPLLTPTPSISASATPALTATVSVPSVLTAQPTSAITAEATRVNGAVATPVVTAEMTPVGTAQAATQGQTSSQPSISIDPEAGGPNTPVQLTGQGFPPSEQIFVYVVRAGAMPGDEVYGRVETDANGSFSDYVVMPSEWPNGEAIYGEAVTVVAGTEDLSASARTPFRFIPGETAAGAAPATGTPQSGAPAITRTPAPQVAGAAPEAPVSQVASVDLDARTIALTGHEGSYLVRVTEDTQIQDENRQPAELSDIQAGQLIAVQEERSETAPITARSIRLLGPDARISLAGFVGSVGAGDRLIMLRPAVRGFNRLQLSEDSSIRGPALMVRSLDAITPGRKILATGRAGQPGTLLVDAVTLLDETTPRPSIDATPAPASTAEAAQPALPVTGWEQMLIPELGVVFDIPEGWRQQGSEWTWAAPGAGAPRVGIGWQNLTQGWRPADMLPEGATILSQRQEWLGLVPGTSFVIQLDEPADDQHPFQTHLVVRLGSRAYDAFSMARSSEELAQLDEVLEHILASVRFVGGAG